MSATRATADLQAQLDRPPARRAVRGIATTSTRDLNEPIIAAPGEEFFVVTEPKLSSTGRPHVQRVTVVSASRNHIRTDNNRTYLARTGLQMGLERQGGKTPILQPVTDPRLLLIEAADQYRATLNRLSVAAATLAAADDPISSGDDEAIVALLASRAEAAKARILELRAAIRRAA